LAGQLATLLVDDLHIVVIFSPVVTDKQHPRPPHPRPNTTQQRGGDTQRPNGQVLTGKSPGHNIPAAITSPHDQRAHGLLQDLTEDQSPKVLTRQPLPAPSLPNNPGGSH
jgi:hypothetical protein